MIWRVWAWRMLMSDRLTLEEVVERLELELLYRDAGA